MKTRYNQFNPKRRFLALGADSLERLGTLAKQVRYGGNPEHKKNPGDFGLTPPSDPRPAKSLCDSVAIFNRALACSLLAQGFRKGMVSDRCVNGWPKNIWAVSDGGVPLEAQLENAALGIYHGYPMPASDPFAGEVLRRWRECQ